MIIHVLGSGEAFDGDRINASYFISDTNNDLLVDCGFTVPHAIWRNNIQNDINNIYITHFHGDHTFGIPALVTRMYEDKRTKPLTFIGQKGLKQYVETIIENAYKSILSKIEFNIIFIEEESKTTINDFKLEFAPTKHSIKNNAIFISNDNTSVCISGDGAPTDELINMYKKNKPSLIIQETYSYNNDSPIHCSLKEIKEMINEHNITSKFAVSHIARANKDHVISEATKLGIDVCEDNKIFTI